MALQNARESEGALPMKAAGRGWGNRRQSMNGCVKARLTQVCVSIGVCMQNKRDFWNCTLAGSTVC